VCDLKFQQINATANPENYANDFKMNGQLVNL